MRTYKTEPKKVVDDVMCDCCGQSTNTSGNSSDIWPSWGELAATWGYGCKNDGMQYNIDLCEDCFTDVVNFLKDSRRKILQPFKFPYDNDPLEGKSYFS